MEYSEIVIMVLSVFVIILSIGVLVLSNRKPEPVIPVSPPKPTPAPSQIKVRPKVGDKGLKVMTTRIGTMKTSPVSGPYEISSDVGVEYEVEVTGVYEGNRVKVKILKIIEINISDPANEAEIQTELEKYYYVGMEKIEEHTRVNWMVEKCGTLISISNKDLSQLVREGGTNVGGVLLELTKDYDYRDRLEIVLES